MQRSNTIIKNRTYTSNDVLHYFQLFNSNSHFTLKAQSHLTRRTVKDPSFIPSASCEPSLLKETLRTDSSMLQRASRVWSGRLHSLRQRDTRHQCGGRSTVQKVKCHTDLTERSSLPVTATGCLGCRSRAHSSPSLWPCISRTGLSRSRTMTSKISLSWVPAKIRSAFQQTLRIERPETEGVYD